jgi:hypothetical protein
MNFLIFPTQLYYNIHYIDENYLQQYNVFLIEEPIKKI